MNDFKFNEKVNNEIQSIEKMMFKRGIKVSLDCKISSNETFSISCIITDNENRKIQNTSMSKINSFINKNSKINSLSLSVIRDCFDKYLSEIAKERIKNYIKNEKTTDESIDNIIEKSLNVINNQQKKINIERQKNIHDLI